MPLKGTAVGWAGRPQQPLNPLLKREIAPTDG